MATSSFLFFGNHFAADNGAMRAMWVSISSNGGCLFNEHHISLNFISID